MGLVGLGLAFYSPGAAARAAPAGLLKPTVEEEQLQRRLLAEILDEPDRAIAPAVRPTRTDPAPLRSTAPLTYSEEVGAAVASVPTWPVMAVVVILAGILFWFKRAGHLGGGQSKAINKLATVALGGKRSIALVEVLGQKLVLGLSEKGLSLLARIDQDAGDLPAAGLESANEALDPFEEELRDLIATDERPPGSASRARDERHELARKFQNLGSH
jgi:flagellar biogenesis protein FliO